MEDIKCCSFCKRTINQVQRLASSGDEKFAICDECVVNTLRMFGEGLPEKNQLFYSKKTKSTSEAEYKFENLKKEQYVPQKIYSELNKYIIGQDTAKKALSVAVYNHINRIKNPSKDVEISKSNILLLGPTGTGKTLFAQSLAKYLDVPFAIADATSLTSAGYVGDDVETVLTRLVQNADMDIKKAECGIIYIDEIDKIAKKGQNVSITRDVSGECVQQALLKIIEGTVCNVPIQGNRKQPSNQQIQIDTKNILFICGGAFVGLDNIIKQRLEKSSIGFGANIINKKTETNLIQKVKNEDLIQFGMIPEFLGRLPITATLEELNINSLISILTEPKDSIVKQYKYIFEQSGVELKFTNEALVKIAEYALEQKTGARGLRAILEEILLDLMYEIPSSENITEIVIDENFVNNKLNKALVA